MNAIVLENHSEISNRDCADLATMAEQELSAFFRAVTELYGPEQAALSAEDWLNEVAASNDLPASTREWRFVTGKASMHLASRVRALSLSTIATN